MAGGGRERARRKKIELGEKSKAGPIRDPAVAAAGTADVKPVSDDLDLDVDVPTVYDGDNEDTYDGTDRVVTEDETLGILRGLGRGNAVTKEERSDEVPPNNQNLPQ